MLDSIKDTLKSVDSGITSGISAAGNLYKQANDAARNFQKSTTNREPIPPRAGAFNKQKYDIAQHTYPADLMSEPYGGNYVIFYINVATESKLNVKENTVTLDANTEKRMRGSLVAKGMSVAQLVTADAAVNVLSNIAGGKSAIGTSSGATKVDTALSAAGMLGVAVAGTMAPDASRSQRRLKTAIALHIPNQLSVRYGVTWSDEDTFNLQAAESIMSALSKEGAKNKLAAAGSGQEALAGMALQKAPGAAAASAALGIAANPKKEQTFKGVDFRKFTFDYQFFPRSPEEAAAVINIINEFKLHMHPEYKSEQNFVYIYPSEFDITYYTGGIENANLHRHTSCVLEEMSVNYTPNGSFSVFPNGMPTQINMSLGFKELQLLSKEAIQGGL